MTAVKTFIKWVVVTFGRDLLILGRDLIQSQWKRAFASRNILILGERQTGKTSLALYLQHGKPFETIDGEKCPPNPTAMVGVLDKKFELQRKNWLKLKQDVPGDLSLRDTWAQAIHELKPQGLIYMVDGRLDEQGLRDAVSAIAEHVLVLYEDSRGALAALHVFINFADVWRLEKPRHERVAEAALRELLDDSPTLSGLRTGVHSTQLSPNQDSWGDIERALHHFGADLLV